MRDWVNEGQKFGFEFIEKDGEFILFKKDGFVFKCNRHSYPTINVSPRNCITPTEYYKFLVKKVHGDTYDLSDTVFKDADSPVVASCKKHGSFSIQASQLTSKRGCPFCGRESSAKKRTLTSLEFVERANQKHFHKYDYSLTNYVGNEIPVVILCKKHGEFSIKPVDHIAGNGCKSCGWLTISNKLKLTQEQAILNLINVHGERYDYSKAVYTLSSINMDIVCKIHGKFSQTYNNHYNGKGCPICAKELNPRFKSGFLKGALAKKYASLYLIRCWNNVEEFYKIGITTKELSVRFSGKSMPYRYEVVILFVAEGETIWNLETALHRYYKNLKYIPTLEFGGRYECFSHINKEDFEEQLKRLTT